MVGGSEDPKEDGLDWLDNQVHLSTLMPDFFSLDVGNQFHIVDDIHDGSRDLKLCVLDGARNIYKARGSRVSTKEEDRGETWTIFTLSPYVSDKLSVKIARSVNFSR
ncbi:MAG TPA: hypothetical protein VHY32_01080, partial [Caulobacteraceae bacterium]|nr:hypothetical protein [Caulobacteraceae bacterium]